MESRDQMLERFLQSFRVCIERMRGSPFGATVFIHEEGSVGAHVLTELTWEQMRDMFQTLSKRTEGYE